MMGRPLTIPVSISASLRYLLLLTILCLPILLYQSFYTNSFFPIVEGWYSAYGHMIRAGAIPYLNLPLLLPPLYPLQIALFQSLFGEQIIVLHYIGMALTCCIAILLFLVLRELFNEWIAAFSAMIGLIYFQSGNTFIGYDFIEFETCYALAAALLLIWYARTFLMQTKQKKQSILLISSGFFMGLAVLTKQSNGGFVTLFLGLGAFLTMVRALPTRQVLANLIKMLGGFLAPFLCVCIWLWHYGALAIFFKDVTGAAASAKGGLYISLTTWIKQFFLSDVYRIWSWQILYEMTKLVFVIAGFSLLFELGRSPFRKKRLRLHTLPHSLYIAARYDSRARYMVILAALLFCLLVIEIYHNYSRYSFHSRSLGQWIYNGLNVWSVNLYLVGFVLALALFFYRPQRMTAQYVLLFAFGLGLIFGNGMSAGLCEISTFLGYALALAFLLQLSMPYMFPAIIPLYMVFSFSTLLIERKFSDPYHWWSIETPDVRNTVTCADTQDILSGLCISERKFGKILRIEKDITTYSDQEPIYIFPHTPIFYLLTNRPPFANALISWFDIVSDAQAIEISQHLEEAPPAVIVVAKLPEIVLATHERLFRGGKPMGQRQILSVIAQLEQAHSIELVDIVKDIDGIDFAIYARKNPN